MGGDIISREYEFVRLTLGEESEYEILFLKDSSNCIVVSNLNGFL